MVEWRPGMVRVSCLWFLAAVAAAAGREVLCLPCIAQLAALLMQHGQAQSLPVFSSSVRMPEHSLEDLQSCCSWHTLAA